METDWTLEMNKFGALSLEEFKSLNFGYSKKSETSISKIKRLDTSNLPTEVDWNSKGVVNPVKN